MNRHLIVVDAVFGYRLEPITHFLGFIVKGEDDVFCPRTDGDIQQWYHAKRALRDEEPLTDILMIRDTIVAGPVDSDMLTGREDIVEFIKLAAAEAQEESSPCVPDAMLGFEQQMQEFFEGRDDGRA